METIFYDKTFRPDLVKRFLPKAEKALLRCWGMDSVGLPVSTQNRMKAAVWPGIRGIMGEAPILAVVTEPKRAAEPGDNIWYIGMLAISAGIERPMSLPECLDAAEFGPSNLPDAFSLLAKFAPPEHYADDYELL